MRDTSVSLSTSQYGTCIADVGVRFESAGFGVSCFVFRVSCFGFRVSGFGLRVSGVGV